MSPDTMTSRSEATGTADTGRTSTLAPTAASTVALPDEPINGMDFQDDQSQTSYAVSLGDGNDEAQLQLPSLLDDSKGATSFECPLCWTIQNFRKESAWRRHNFMDLRPYVCTSENCDVKIFAGRRDWIEHEIQCHRQRWSCQFSCKVEFNVLQRYWEHLRQVHVPDVSDDQLDVIAQASARPVNAILASDCPFCDNRHSSLYAVNPSLTGGDIFVTPLHFRDHVWYHMQSLALLAITRGYLEDDELCTGSAAGSQVAAAGSDVASDTNSMLRHFVPPDDLPLGSL